LEFCVRRLAGGVVRQIVRKFGRSDVGVNLASGSFFCRPSGANSRTARSLVAFAAGSLTLAAGHACCEFGFAHFGQIVAALGLNGRWRCGLLPATPSTLTLDRESILVAKCPSGLEVFKATVDLGVWREGIADATQAGVDLWLLLIKSANRPNVRTATPVLEVAGRSLTLANDVCDGVVARVALCERASIVVGDQLIN
jgi:hypothetical protein